jgi:flagellar protein FliO/FliZ
MWDMLFYLAIVLFLAVAMIGGAFVVRTYLSGGAPMQAMGSLFGGPKPLRRLSISEQFNLDAKRRLILVRRDNVEHLIMTGGPVDMLIETGIAVSPDALRAENAAQGTPGSARFDPTLR